MDLSALAQQAIALFQQHQPWLVEKLGTAAISQAVKELWDRTKTKLGGEATQKVEQKPEDASQWKILEAKLLLAIDEDKAFAESARELISRGGSAPAGISQKAQGIANRQVAVEGSQDVKIRVK